MPELSEYAIEFRRNTLLGLWFYTITCPDGEQLTNFGFGFADKHRAETDALRRIEIHRSNYTLTGQELKEKLNAAE